jgi:hypothetical protein
MTIVQATTSFTAEEAQQLGYEGALELCKQVLREELQSEDLEFTCTLRGNGYIVTARAKEQRAA